MQNHFLPKPSAPSPLDVMDILKTCLLWFCIKTCLGETIWGGFRGWQAELRRLFWGTPLSTVSPYLTDWGRPCQHQVTLMFIHVPRTDLYIAEQRSQRRVIQLHFKAKMKNTFRIGCQLYTHFNLLAGFSRHCFVSEACAGCFYVLLLCVDMDGNSFVPLRFSCFSLDFTVFSPRPFATKVEGYANYYHVTVYTFSCIL